MRVVLKNFRIVDEDTDAAGNVIIEDGIISEVSREQIRGPEEDGAAMVIDGACLLSQKSGASQKKLPVLMPAFVDLHAHFRDPGIHEKDTLLPSEVLESASLAAAAGGFGTVVCMANTRPAIDSPEKAAALKERSDVLGLIDLYPVVSLTKGMEGKELSGITLLAPRPAADPADKSWQGPLMLSEDGRDLADDALFLAAMKEAARIGIPISCHCDFGGDEALAAKNSGQKRSVWSRIEENNAVRRVIELGRKAGCHIHIAHVSTKEAAELIRRAKAEIARESSRESSGENRDGVLAEKGGFALTCEVMPHNLSLTEEDAARLGDESWGRVNPPLRLEEDRKALIRALADGTIDAIATDHAPHSRADKEAGVPGFSGFETAFAAAFTELVMGRVIDLKRLSSFMSARPARLLGLGRGAQKRGLIAPGYRAGLVIIDTEASRIVDPAAFKTRGKNSPFAGRRLSGQILMTLHSGRPVFQKP